MPSPTVEKLAKLGSDVWASMRVNDLEPTISTELGEGITTDGARRIRPPFPSAVAI